MLCNDRPQAVCSHLAAAEADDYHVWFSGRGTEHFWVCPACVSRYPQDSLIPLLAVDDELYERCASNACWEGIQGKPAASRRLTTLLFEHCDLSVLVDRDKQIVDVQPHPCAAGDWLALSSSGELWAVNPREGRRDLLQRLGDLNFSLDDETGLTISPAADYVAVYQTSGQQACVIQLETGEITARIDRGKYRPENSHFPIAFFEHQGRTHLVAGVDWNRLDILDPATGASLTERAPTSYQRGEPRPPNYLDYFHAQLVVSPQGNWIADNGWAWHPWGYVRTWNLVDWLKRSPWESDSGSSLRALPGRAYYWDGPICWTSDDTLALWGWGRDEEWMIPAIQLVNVASGDRRWFPGPNVRSPRAWPPKKLAPSLIFDQYLFAVHGQSGTEVWDVATGELLLHDALLTPIHYHPGSREFISLTPDGIRLSRLTEHRN